LKIVGTTHTDIGYSVQRNMKLTQLYLNKKKLHSHYINFLRGTQAFVSYRAPQK
jgi:hypothetical protein